VLIGASLIVASFRISSNADVEVITVLFLDVLDQIPGISEATFRLHPLLFFPRWVASQSQNVGTSGVVGLLQRLINLAALHVGASEMHASLQTVCRLSNPHNFTCELREAAASTPSDIYKGWSEAVHPVHAVVEVLNTLCGLGREELEGVCRSVAGAGRLQLLGDVHCCGYW
jgi:hypothetical protein